jgi:hypothetical protein
MNLYSHPYAQGTSYPRRRQGQFNLQTLWHFVYNVCVSLIRLALRTSLFIIPLRCASGIIRPTTQTSLRSFSSGLIIFVALS